MTKNEWIDDLNNHQKESVEKFLNSLDNVRVYGEDNLEYIKENYGEEILKDKNMILDLTLYFLMNSHEIISSMAMEFCDLGKSTYDANTYVTVGRDRQNTMYESMHYDDINDFLKTTKSISDVQEFIDGYFSCRE